MTLEFCPRCENILIPEKINEKEFWAKCAHCDFSKKLKSDSVLVEKEKILHKHNIGRVFKTANWKNEFATYKHKCQKCGYGKAQVIDMGIFYSDEDNLILLKCGKCGWAERVGKKVS